MPDALMLSPAEAGRVLGCSDVTIRRMVRAGELRADQRGRNMKIARAEIERYAGKQLGPTAAEKERRQLCNRLLALNAEMAAIVAKLARLEG